MADEQDKRSRDADALNAMAEGAGGPAGEAQEQGAPAESAEAGAVAEIAEAAEPLAGRGDWRAAVEQQTRLVHARQYKRTMIPLLLVVGALLLALSAVTLVMLLSASSPDPYHMKSHGTILQNYGGWIVLIAMPFAVLLLLGAWLLHREVRRPDE